MVPSLRVDDRSDEFGNCGVSASLRNFAIIMAIAENASWNSENLARPAPSDSVEVSVVIPCLNEANSLGICVTKAIDALRAAGLRGEVVVADNGSTDGSIELAEKLGARVIRVERSQFNHGLTRDLGAAASRCITHRKLRGERAEWNCGRR